MPVRSPLKSRVLPALAALLVLAGCQSARLDSADLVPSRVNGNADLALGYAEVRAPAGLVVDFASGRTLYEDQADALRYPASLTKMMTLYLLFDAVKAGRVSLDDTFLVSPYAAGKPPSKLGLKAGERVRVSDLAHAVATKSANDAATVVAENLGGTEEGFVRMMMAKARQLGMTRTRFVNPTGLPDQRQISTARDLARLARALRLAHPQFCSFFSQPGYSYLGKSYRATNKLLGTVPGVDGMKTGYIRDSGFNLVASAERGGKRVIVVVIGGATSRARDIEVTRLIDTYLGPASAAPAMAALTAN